MIENIDKLKILSSIETCLPGIVKRVNGKNIDVEILIKKVLYNGIVDIENKFVTNVPVIYTGSSSFTIDYKLKENDLVLLICMSRDSGKWKLNKKSVSIPNSCVGNTLSDFVAIPFSIEKGKSSIVIDDDGTMTLNENVTIKL